MKSAILISTCNRYFPLARFTARMIDSYWPAHPPLLFCGLSDLKGQPGFASGARDQSDWVGITQDAVAGLRRMGYAAAYLILEDHPPFGRCHVDHLNSTLPDLMERLGAAYIGLYGWDQRTRSSGELLGRSFRGLQRQSEDFDWRFSLHPGLWNLEALEAILAALPPVGGDERSRLPWAFERRSGAADFPLPSQWRNRSYRIRSLSMLAGGNASVRTWGRRLEFRAIDVLRWTVRTAGGESALQQLDARLAPVLQFHDGPYPLFWSGLLRKGAWNLDAETFLRWRGRRDFLRRWGKLKAEWRVPQ